MLVLKGDEVLAWRTKQGWACILSENLQLRNDITAAISSWTAHERIQCYSLHIYAAARTALTSAVQV